MPSLAVVDILLLQTPSHLKFTVFGNDEYSKFPGEK